MPRVEPARREWTAVPSVGVSVHARVWPGPATLTPLVLVAGLGVSSRYWARLGRRLAGRHAVFAPDLPGFGRTPPPPGAPWPAGPSVREQANQLLAWMDARGIDRAVLCGHSVGCQGVVDLATRFPERVERIVLAAPPFEPGRRSLAISLLRLALGALFEVPSLPLLLGVEYASAGPARALQQALRSMDYPMERQLPLVALPTLVIHGQFDPLVSQRWADTVAGLVPGAKLMVVEQVGHAMHYSAPAVTAEVIGRFLLDDLNGDARVPQDDPRQDPLGPPQPISPAAFALLGGALAILAIILRRQIGRASYPIAIAGLLGCVKRVPMVTRTAVTAGCGTGLVVTAVAGRRRGLAGIGLWQIAVALLTAKPTGPARIGSPRP